MSPSIGSPLHSSSKRTNLPASGSVAGQPLQCQDVQVVQGGTRRLGQQTGGQATRCCRQRWQALTLRTRALREIHSTCSCSCATCMLAISLRARKCTCRGGQGGMGVACSGSLLEIWVALRGGCCATAAWSRRHRCCRRVGGRQHPSRTMTMKTSRAKRVPLWAGLV